MSGQKVLTKDIVELFLADEESVDLSKFTAVEDEAAGSLSKYEDDLALDGLVNLSDAAAESFRKHQGGLSLNGVTELSGNAGVSLASHQGSLFQTKELSLLGLTQIADEAIMPLTENDCARFSPELLSKEVLDAWRSTGFRTLTKGEVMGQLHEFIDSHLDFLDYYWIEDDATDQLAMNLILDGRHSALRYVTCLTLCVFEISDYTAERLSKLKVHEIWLSVNRLSDPAAASLINYEGYLELPCLSQLSDAGAEILSKKEIVLTLDNLPPSAAKILRDAGHGV